MAEAPALSLPELAKRTDALAARVNALTEEEAGSTPAARWKRMEQLLSEPTLPSDLKSAT